MITNTNCVRANVLRLAWYMSAPDVADKAKRIYEAHRQECATCKQAMTELTQQAKNANMPALSDK